MKIVADSSCLSKIVLFWLFLLQITLSFVAERRTLCSYPAEDSANWHSSNFKFELESFCLLVPHRTIVTVTVGFFIPYLQHLSYNSAVVAARSLAVTSTDTAACQQCHIGQIWFTELNNWQTRNLKSTKQLHCKLSHWQWILRKNTVTVPKMPQINMSTLSRWIILSE